ncbi:hypothetical protein GCM10028803_04950 [Larkinella knui]|uniref:Uncharacterized protein n=1 Tax=Larkinella knui TaxID=2025310 RepID=A0A3P1CKI8_9BACT|nr:hypothetical protein [Larkinella knui]RRB13827.1 hypothetical protein EHT87_16340 [Larkinella knui]
MPLFSVEILLPIPKMNGLEAHLIATAKAWAKGEGHMKPVSLTAFLMMLKNEYRWYCADNPRTSAVNVWLTDAPIHRQEIIIQSAGSDKPSAKIKAKNALNH